MLLNQMAGVSGLFLANGSVAHVQPMGQGLDAFSQGVSRSCSAWGGGQGLVFSQEAVLVHTCGCLMAGSCMCMEIFM